MSALSLRSAIVVFLAAGVSCTGELPPIDEVAAVAEPSAVSSTNLSRLAITDIAVAAAQVDSPDAGFRVTMNATVVESLRDPTSLVVKAVCRHGRHALASISDASALDGTRLADLVIGDRLAMSATIMQEGLPRVASPCQLSFSLADASTQHRAIPLHTACWTATATSDGPCDPAVSGVPGDEIGPPIEIDALTAMASNPPGTPGFTVRYLLKLNRIPRLPSHVVVESACEIEGLRLVDTQEVAAFDRQLVMGESLARSSGMYWDPAFEITKIPSRCEIEFSVRKSADDSFIPIPLGTWCMEDGVVVGTCKARAPTAAAPATRDAIAIESRRIALLSPGGTGGPYTLSIRAQLTMKKRIERRLEITASCADIEPEPWSAELPLAHLEAGETTRVEWQPFLETPMAAFPESCELRFGLVADPGSSSGRAPAPALALATYCLDRGKSKPGRCR